MESVSQSTDVMDDNAAQKSKQYYVKNNILKILK